MSAGPLSQWISLGRGRTSPTAIRHGFEVLSGLLAHLHAHVGREAWWSPHVWDRNHRKSEAWESASCIAIDIDFIKLIDGKSEHVAPPDDLRPLPTNAVIGLGATLVHQTPRGLRAVWVFAEQCSNREAWIAAATHLCDQLLVLLADTGFEVDRGASLDLARLFWTSGATVDGHKRTDEVQVLGDAVHLQDLQADDRDHVHEGVHEAVLAYRRAHPLDIPRSGGECPACGHRDCFGRMPTDQDRWACFSSSHEADSGGVGLQGARCWHGDVLDLHAHAAGCSRVELLRGTGWLGGARPSGRSQGSSPASTKDRPSIILNPGDLRPAITAAEDALLAASDVEPIYQRDGQIVRVVCTDEPTTLRQGVVTPANTLMIAPAGQTFMRTLFEEAALFMRVNKSKDQYRVSCPADLVRGFAESAGLWRLPHLRGIVTAPALRADGTILQSPGYDPESGLLYDPCGVRFPAIKDAPSLDDAKAALRYLLTPVEHFQFCGDSRSVWLAAVLTPFARGMLPSAPMFIFDAPTRGSGKSKLAATAGIIPTGRMPTTMTFVDDADEARKRIVALLRVATSIINIDNVDVPLGGAALCTILTEPVFEDRLLGTNEIVRVSTAATWLGTGNNVCMVGDLPRRVLVCRIDPHCENPEDRQFPFDPVLLAQQRRPELVAAALTLLRAHAVAGRPQCGMKPYGSFEAWSEVIRAACVWAGEPDPLVGRQHIVEQDGGVLAMRVLMVAWHAQFGAQAVTVKHAMEHGGPELQTAIAELIGDVPPVNRSRVLGGHLAKSRDRIMGGYQVVQGASAQGGVLRWASIKS